MRVELETAACCGHGACAEIVPHVFAIDDSDGLARILIEEPGETDRQLLELAVAECPTDAISLRP